jgi:hypothetical protein
MKDIVQAVALAFCLFVWAFWVAGCGKNTPRIVSTSPGPQGERGEQGDPGSDGEDGEPSSGLPAGCESFVEDCWFKIECEDGSLKFQLKHCQFK